MSSRGIRGFAYSDKTASDKKHGEGWSEAAGHGGKAPQENAVGDDLGLIEAVGKKSGRNTGQSEDNKEHHLQGTELRITHAEVLAQKRDQRIEYLPIGKVDKIDQSKYSKESRLCKREWGFAK